MASTIAKLLLVPFTQGALEAPKGEATFGYFDAHLFEGPGLDRKNLRCFQPERGSYLALQTAGFTVDRSFDPQKLDGALIAGGRHKRRNEANFAKAWSCLEPGSPLVIAGLKREGIASFRKFAAQFAEIEGQTAKHHGTVFWLRKAQSPDTISVPEPVRVDGFVTGPGMFSHEKVDRGSNLLAAHFTRAIAGNVADLGAGWGYLSSQLLSRSSAVRQVDLYEANWDALDAARANLQSFADRVRIDCFWIDLTAEKPTRTYDWIVMNPPFHSGGKGDPNLGIGFIDVAHKALARSGALLMVANQHLPYENPLKHRFREVSCLEVRDGFKVLLCRRPTIASQR